MSQKPSFLKEFLKKKGKELLKKRAIKEFSERIAAKRATVQLALGTHTQKIVQSKQPNQN